MRKCSRCGHDIHFHEDFDGDIHECTYPNCNCPQYKESELLLLCTPCFAKRGLQESLTLGLIFPQECDDCHRWVDPMNLDYNFIWAH